MAVWTPYSTDPAISAAYAVVDKTESLLKSCSATRSENKCTSYTPDPIYAFDPQLNQTVNVAPRSGQRCNSVTVDNKGSCAKLERDLALAKQKLEDLERAESQVASFRKNALATAARQAQQSADDAAALPGLKRDELACNELSERTRCRQLRERIAGIERRLSGSSNAQPTSPASNKGAPTSPLGLTNPVQAQPAAPPKPFTLKPAPASKTRLRRPQSSAQTTRTKVRRARGAAVVRAARVSSASSA